jgi:tyrosinase
MSFFRLLQPSHRVSKEKDITNMTRLMQVAFYLVGLLALVTATPTERQAATCTTKTAHKPWQMLTRAEQTAFIKAEVCLMEAPSKSGVPGAKTRWDDLQYNHIVQTHLVHDVGHFLPWHRYYIAVHGFLLRDECGYTGPLPYWDETGDSSLTDLLTSPVFKKDAFGGTGSGSNRYITDGAFANTTLRLQRPGTAPREYRIARTLNARQLRGAGQTALNACFQVRTYTAAWECWGGQTHSAGHAAVGGLGGDVVLSPGDPAFFLHHGWLDAMWWRWQMLDLPKRLTDIGGRNIATAAYLRALRLDAPGPEWTEYDGDSGSVTTLNHVLYAANLRPNVTVGDIMDVRGNVICAEYFFSDSFNVTTTEIVDGILTTVTE